MQLSRQTASLACSKSCIPQHGMNGCGNDTPGILALRRWRSEVRIPYRPWLYSKFKVSVGYVRSYLKNKLGGSGTHL